MTNLSSFATQEVAGGTNWRERGCRKCH